MDALIKIGGSVLQTDAIHSLCATLDELSQEFSFVLLPGGGEYADLVRKHFLSYQLTEDTAHWMAILSENMLGFLLLQYLNRGRAVFNLSAVSEILEKSLIPVFLPFQYLFSQDPLPHSWAVTSDSIALHLAEILHAEKLILVKDVDGIFSQDPHISSPHKPRFLERISLKTQDLANFSNCVDKYLPFLIQKYQRPCIIVNGLFPERLALILRNQKTIKTVIEL